MTIFRLTTVLLMGLLLTVSTEASSQRIEGSKKFTLSPSVYATVGPALFQRSNPEGGAIVRANPGPAPTFLSSGNYDFGWKAGIDATVGLRLTKSSAIEARLLNFDSNDRFNVVTAGNFIGAGFTGPGGTNIASQYTTKLRSREISWRQALFSEGRFADRVDLLGGLRRITLGDDATYVLNAGVATGQYLYRNRFAGAQIGADVSLLPPSSRFQINIVGKAGRYFGDSHGGINEFAGVVPIGGFGRRESENVTGLEGAISARYHFTNSLTGHVGYDIFALKNVGLASNNASTSITNPALLNGNVFRDDIIFKGLNIGLTMSF